MAEKLLELRQTVRFDTEHITEGQVLELMHEAMVESRMKLSANPDVCCVTGGGITGVSAIARLFGSRDRITHGDYRLLLLRRSDTEHIDAKFWLKTMQLAHLAAEVRVLDNTIEMNLTKNRCGELYPVRDGQHLFELVQAAVLQSETEEPYAPPDNPAA